MRHGNRNARDLVVWEGIGHRGTLRRRDSRREFVLGRDAKERKDEGKGGSKGAGGDPPRKETTEK